MHSLPDHLKGWVHGWSISRGAPTPVSLAEGYRIDVGRPRHLVRYVLPTPQQELIDQLHEPGTWLKTGGDLPALPPRWTLEPPEYLMATPLSPPATTDQHPRTPRTGPASSVTPAPDQAALPGAVRVAVDGSLVRVTVEVDGVAAARGQVAVWDAYAVFDQVVTEPAFQRRGLGSVVMQELTDTAVRRGARTGVLVATSDGRALYGRLGWDLVSTLGVAWIRP